MWLGKKKKKNRKNVTFSVRFEKELVSLGWSAQNLLKIEWLVF